MFVLAFENTSVASDLNSPNENGARPSAETRGSSVDGHHGVSGLQRPSFCSHHTGHPSSPLYVESGVEGHGTVSRPQSRAIAPESIIASPAGMEAACGSLPDRGTPTVSSSD